MISSSDGGAEPLVFESEGAAPVLACSADAAGAVLSLAAGAADGTAAAGEGAGDAAPRACIECCWLAPVEAGERGVPVRAMAKSSSGPMSGASAGGAQLTRAACSDGMDGAGEEPEAWPDVCDSVAERGSAAAAAGAAGAADCGADVADGAD